MRRGYGAGGLLGRASGDAAGGGDGDGEPDAHEEVLLRRVGQAGDDADDLAVPVEQRAAGVAGVDGRVELDQALEGLAGADADRPVERRDDAAAQGLGQAEGVAEREDLVADLGAPAEDGGHDDLRESLRRKDGGVARSLLVLDVGAGLRAVGEPDADRVGTVDDVQGGQDGALGADDDPGAGAVLVGVGADTRRGDGDQ